MSRSWIGVEWEPGYGSRTVPVRTCADQRRVLVANAPGRTKVYGMPESASGRSVARCHRAIGLSSGPATGRGRQQHHVGDARRPRRLDEPVDALRLVVEEDPAHAGEGRRERRGVGEVGRDHLDAGGHAYGARVTAGGADLDARVQQPFDDVAADVAARAA